MSKPGFYKTLLIFLTAFAIAIVPLSLYFPQSACADEPEVEYWAVIVGVADYQSTWLDTDYADDNAVDLAAQLAPIWGEDHIKLLVNSEATKDDIEDAIREWLNEREDAGDVVLFYFSGHGSFEFVIPCDARISGRGVDDYLQDNELAKWLGELDTDNIAIVLDSCYSGSFINDVSQSGMVILASSRENQTSWLSELLEHGVFTYPHSTSKCNR